MFDLCSERLLDDEERFAGRDGHRFAEIWVGEGRTPVYRSGDLKEKEIVSWMKEERTASGRIHSGLRILLSPKPSGRSSSGKLPFSKQTYIALSRAWRIPSTCIRAVTQKLSVVIQSSVEPIIPSCAASSSPTVHSFAYQDNGSADREKELDQPSGISTISSHATCLLVRGDVDWTWDYTLVQIDDPVTQTTHALILGLTATEIDLLLCYLARISSTCAAPTNPALLPLILLDLAANETASLLELRVKLMSQIQQRTGMDRFNSLRSATMFGERVPRKSYAEERKDLDLDAIMLRLTCLSDWVAAQRGFIGIQERVSDVVHRMLRPSDHGDLLKVFHDRLTFVRESLLAADQKCMYLERSISAQVQTVYSLIAQKDNRLNHSATKASCQIASDSRRIAILTRRDSTDMRIIAAVTLIFLPGTTIASVFSTGLFDWGHGDPTPAGSDDSDDGGGQMISKYIWVYFMLTGALTAVVLMAWGLFSWIQNRKMVRKFGFDFDYEEGSEGKVWDDEEKKVRRDTQITLRDKSAVFTGWQRLLIGSKKLLNGNNETLEEDVKLA